MNLNTAIERLDYAEKQQTGASTGAATVLLFGWSGAYSMRGLASLDSNNRAAALTIIAAALDYKVDCGRQIEAIIGYPRMQDLAEDYDVSGNVWSS